MKLPAGKILITGVASHPTELVEHPGLVADAIIAFAELVGRENMTPEPAATWAAASIRKSPGQTVRPARRRGAREHEVAELNLKVPVRVERNKKQESIESKNRTR